MNENTLATQLLQNLEQADSSDALLEAVEALADARLEATVTTLIAVLSYNNPGAAVAAVDGLVQLGEIAVLPLLNLLDDYNYGGRAWAIRALAEIGDPRALETLLEAAKTDFAMSVRRAAAKGLGYLHWSKIPVEQLETAQARVLETLLLSSQDAEWVVRYAAVVGLQGLAVAVKETQPEIVSRIKTHFKQKFKRDPELTVRTRSRLAAEKLQTFNDKMLKSR